METITILDALKRLQNDLRTWCINNFNTKVPLSRKINGKTLEEDIDITTSEIEGVEEIENDINILENQLNGYSLLLSPILPEVEDRKEKTIYFVSN